MQESLGCGALVLCYTVVLAVVMLVSMLANLPNANLFGFLNATEQLFTSITGTAH